MGQFMILVIFSPLSIALIVLRFMAVRRSARNISAEDWLAVLALLFLMLCNIAAIIGNCYMLCYRQLPLVLLLTLCSCYYHQRTFIGRYG
jgi:hypothetical protein